MSTYTLRSANPAKTRCDAVVVGLVQRGKGPRGGLGVAPGGEAVESAYGRSFRPLLASLGVTGKAGEVTKVRDELIGPSLGDELRQKALIALAVALGAQLIYLAVRFRFTFGGAAVLAMFHDVAIVTGVFAWLGKPIDGVFLAALLTVIGYSVNDSVVVFDRVREALARSRKTPFAQAANTAVLQTLPRTVNTGMGAVFILAALLLLGGDSLADFALALLLGIAVGTYSSVFTATPLAVVFDAQQSRPARPVRSRTPEPVRP